MVTKVFYTLNYLFPQSESDTVELIMAELTSSHSRMQVLKELKKQGLINSAKDLKKKTIRFVYES